VSAGFWGIFPPPCVAFVGFHSTTLHFPPPRYYYNTSFLILQGEFLFLEKNFSAISTFSSKIPDGAVFKPDFVLKFTAFYISLNSLQPFWVIFASKCPIFEWTGEKKT
jgi:hypothetical protein